MGGGGRRIVGDCIGIATVVGGVKGVEICGRRANWFVRVSLVVVIRSCRVRGLSWVMRVRLVMMVSGWSVLGLIWFGSGGGSISCNICRIWLGLSTVVNLLDFSSKISHNLE